MRRHGRSTTTRRATAYATVIGATALITVIGLSALTAIRVERRLTGDAEDFTKAMDCARSGIEKGLHIVSTESNWRAGRIHGNWEQNKPLGDGTYTLAGYDPTDAILGDSRRDPLRLEATGSAGDASYRLRVDLQATGGGYRCLEVPLHAHGPLAAQGGANVTSNGPLSTNNTASAGGALINANVEAVGSISGSTYLGSMTTPITPRQMPAATVLDYYKDGTRATRITMASLPKDDGILGIGGTGERAIMNVTLSAANNPYGAKNLAGLYYIDCGGAKLVIRDAKIHATLTVVNANEVRLMGSVNWQPSVSNYPSLLVQGMVKLEISATNFLLGLDLLPSEIRGLFYATSDIEVDGNVKVFGVLVGGNKIDLKGTLALTYDQTYYDDPPPGFGTPLVMETVAGSWRRLVN